MLQRDALYFFYGAGQDIMPKFKVGDQVERIGALVPQYMKHGIITRVIPNQEDWFTQYEVNFGDKTIATFYETQLRHAEDGSSYSVGQN